MKKLTLVFFLILGIHPWANAKGGGHSHHYSHSTYHSNTSSYSHHRSNYAGNVPRDSHGRIKRSSSAKHQFMKETGYPNGRPGYVVDHVVPLKRGGADLPSNMQWQTKEDAKIKDKIE